MASGNSSPGGSSGRPYIGVIGASQATEKEVLAAEQVGAGLAAAGAIVITGGGSGVMEGASRGAAQAGGLVVGILPGGDRVKANPWVGVALPTGLGELRNGLIVRSSDVLVAVAGAYGTLSEIALALTAGVPVVGLGTWAIDGVRSAASASDAVTTALKLAGGLASGT